MDIIHLLSDNIANQIAAGEVVQRPASVVKELLENAIDAKASEIKLIVKDSGKTLIQVIDNGIGMSVTDCRMCFERHATSKISTSDDLFAIKTMGFRGEALASIAAVAQVEMRTRRADDELGTCVQIEGSEFKGQEPVSAPLGTSFMVKNLFFNVPARRKFLKSNPVEMKHILDEFQRVALAHPEVGFEVYHNDVELYKLPSAKLAKRIVDVFGKNYRQQLAACEESTPYVSIKGYVGKPESAKKTRGDQYFFINHRFIKSGYLHHAITGAFEGTIPDGHHPFYVLNIEIDPKHVDINIHPQKTEIKFDDEKAVYSILRSAVRQAIGVYNLTPSIDFESDINFGNLTSTPLPEKKPSAFEKSGSAIGNFERKTSSPKADWKPLYEGLESAANYQKSEPQISLSSRANFKTETEEDQPATSEFSKPLEEEVDAVQIHQKYLVLQVKSGMLLIDQKAAWERILFEQYEKNLQNKSGASQQLLFQKTLNLKPEEFALAMDLKDEIHALGFGFEVFGSTSLIINGIPTELGDEEGAKALEDLISQYKENQTSLTLDKTQNLARAFAKRTAHRSVRTMDKREISSLINRLFETSMPTYTPGGQKIMKIIPLEEIAELISGTGGF
ncbi:DNA mismatch repair endonuclease MutL [Jiulongibacter sp. NS-SX5]|uniref:DNA mismatch repair endonuclease MutL n=1 Tax=Jiulongibacter sp. NS-SX5 TaxID=3463854 RepID=UPI00405A0B52